MLIDIHLLYLCSEIKCKIKTYAVIMHEFLVSRHPFLLQVSTWNVTLIVKQTVAWDAFRHSKIGYLESAEAGVKWLRRTGPEVRSYPNRKWCGAFTPYTAIDWWGEGGTVILTGFGYQWPCHSVRAKILRIPPTHPEEGPGRLGSWPGPSVLVLFSSRANPCKSEPPVFLRINCVCLCSAPC